MRLGVSNPEFAEEALEELLPRLEKHFDLWEMVCERGHHLETTAPELELLLPSYSLDLQFHAPFSDVNLASVNRRMWNASLEELLHTLETASKLCRRPVVTVHPGTFAPATFNHKGRAIERAREGVRALKNAAEEYGVELALENMPVMYILFAQDPDELTYLADGAGVCIDLGHANTTEHLDKYLEMAETAANVHLHDNNGERDEHLTLGDGTLPLDRVASMLERREGATIIEAKSLESAVRSKDVVSGILS